MKAKENVRNDDINLQTGALTDLPVTDERAYETRGGSGSGTRDSHFRESTFGNELMSA